MVDDKELDSNKDSLAFAVSLIGFCIIAIYTIIPGIFAENINADIGIAAYLLQIAVSTFTGILFVFIFLKGYSLSQYVEKNTKSKIDKICSYLYEVSFSLLYLVAICTMLLYCSAPLIIKNPTFNPFIILIIICFAVIRVLYKVSKYPKLNQKVEPFKFNGFIFLFIVLLIACLVSFVFDTKWINQSLSVISTISLFLLLFFEIISFIPDYQKDKLTDKKTKENENDKFIIFFMSISALLFVLIIYSSTNVALTTIDVEMEQIYDQNQSLIPIKVQVNGVNGDLHFIMYNDSINYFTNQITNVSFDVKKPYDVQGNDIVTGTYLGDGKYEFYLNTTCLKADYYAIQIKSVRAVERTTFHLVSTK